MKVLLVNSLYPPHVVGGAELSLQLLAEGLKDEGITPVVLSTSDRDEQANMGGVKVYYVRTRNLYWMKNAKQYPRPWRAAWHVVDTRNPFVGRVLREVIQAEQPHLVHTHNLAGWSTHMWNVADTLHIPVVHTLRDLYLLCIRSTMYKGGAVCDRPCRTCALFSRPKRQASRHVDAVIGVSRFILDRHVNLGFFNHASHQTTIPNPVKLTGAGRHMPQAGRPLAFGFVGALAPHKGIELLLRLFSERRDGNATLHLYGQGFTAAYQAELIARYASEHIRFEGWTAPAEIFEAIDVLIVPSLCQEAFGRVVVEAYAAGVPVIASDRGGLAELVDMGRTGYLFDPARPEQLSEVIDQFVDDRDRIARMAGSCRDRARVSEPKAIVEAHLKLYDAVRS